MDDGLQVVVHDGLQVEQEQKCVVPEKSLDQHSDVDKILADDLADKPPGFYPFAGKYKQDRKRICGVRRLIFWGLILLLAVVAVGVGLGVSLSKKSTKSSPPTPTSTHSTSVPATSTTAPPAASTSGTTPFPACGCGILPYDCPSVDQTQYNSTVGSGSATYQYLCNEDFGAFTGTKGRLNNDISITNASTIQDCMDACTSWNLPNTTPCLGITFHANLTFIIESKGNLGNCFLKRNASSPTPFKLTRYGVSARLLLS